MKKKPLFFSILSIEKMKKNNFFCEKIVLRRIASFEEMNTIWMKKFLAADTVSM